MSQARRAVSRFVWEDGPMHLISTSVSPGAPISKSTLIHNCLIRALNSIYIQAPHVPMSEYHNFIAYCLATYQGLNANLTTGEMWSDSAAQARLQEWGNWIMSITQKRNNFGPGICRGMMDDFMPGLSIYFYNSTSSAAFLDKLDKATQLPGFLVNHDTNFEGGVHAFPRSGWWTRKVAARKNRQWWKFGTVGSDGKMREVRYVK